ncbi:MAG TPA: type II secretion system minor pseudopilin GspJ [Sphingorhabdus sp.]|jgi:general secretion pathway protein J|nr:type II secretion system minor pseudopilin GspJ [Sphingorhabdus sp.]
MRPAPPSQAGFTLVELLVALAIFALISVAGVTLLRSGSDTQIAVKERLDGLSRANRLTNALESDLAQSVARPVRDAAGQAVPAFIAGDASGVPGLLFGFVRAGWSNFDDTPRAGLQRVAYSLDGRALKRIGWPMLDGAAAGDAATILDNVSAAEVRFRNDAGEWRSDWAASDATALPRAVELRLTLEGEPEQRMLFLVGPQTRIKPQPLGAEAAE